MKSVYLVIFRDYDDSSVEGVFSSEEKAKEFLNNQKSKEFMSIEEWEIQ